MIAVALAILLGAAADAGSADAPDAGSAAEAPPSTGAGSKAGSARESRGAEPQSPPFKG